MTRFSILLALVAAFLLPGQLQAQASESATVESELRSMLVQGSEVEADREAILDFLGEESVADVATRHGFDVDELEREVRAMDDEASADLASRVLDMQQEMAQVGGDTIVITSTTVIIVLLILILIAI